jgi:hypothetical protein
MVFALCIYLIWKSEISFCTETVVMNIYDCESGMGNITLEKSTKAQRRNRCIATLSL